MARKGDTRGDRSMEGSGKRVKKRRVVEIRGAWEVGWVCLYFDYSNQSCEVVVLLGSHHLADT